MGRHRKASKTVAEAVDAAFAYRDEVDLHTIEVVKQMKANGRSKDFGEGYMEGLTVCMDPAVREIAKALFERAWATTE